MSIENKQTGIVKILEQRIADGVYSDKLPKTLDLVAEFEVNFKTLNKAILQLVAKGILYRKPGRGTFITGETKKIEESLIELLFVGSSEIFTHPFYSETWRGILDGINGTGFKLVLTTIEENTKRGGLKHVCKDLVPSAGKILIGTNNTEQIKRLKRSKVPFILVNEQSELPEVISVHTDTGSAIADAIAYLRKLKIKDIAYIGQTSADGEHLLSLNKFYAYLAAIQKKGELNSNLIENTPPFARCGYEAMIKILQHQVPQAVITAYDHLAPGIYDAIKEYGLKIPEDIKVIGIDGINPNVTPKLTSITINRYETGLRAGQQLIAMIRNSRKKYNSQILTAKFDPTAGESVI
ncbi:MAG: GntR family transcriptional regulator [Victivallaceae bacterium]|nr:GntR family transcriptional regulator [Victivallaceae bacterium]